MPDALPPAYDVNPDDLDDEQHPTAAWSVGEIIDPDVAAKLREIREA